MNKYRVRWIEVHEEWIEAKDEDSALEQAGEANPYDTLKSQEDFDVTLMEEGDNEPDDMYEAKKRMEA